MTPNKHTPKAHIAHNSGIPCGCVEDIAAPGTYIDCKICGAAYHWEEASSFPLFRCYDCGAGVYASPRLRTA